MLVAWELGDRFGTKRKVFLYSLKKHSVYALLNPVLESYDQKYRAWYFDLFSTHIRVFRAQRVKPYRPKNLKSVKFRHCKVLSHFKMLVAWELGDRLSTKRKVFLYCLKKHSVYALLNQVLESYDQKYRAWYFDLFSTHIRVFRAQRVNDTLKNDFQCLKQLWITFKHHFQSFWSVWSFQKKFEKNF